MATNDDTLTLKWGSLKGWEISPENLPAIDAFERWASGGVSMSAALHHDTPEQKQALCDLIDACDGTIWNDWTGDKLTKDEAKAYVLEYGKERAS